MEPHPSAKITLVEILYIFILPVVLLYFNIINKEWRVTVLLVASLLIYGIVKKGNWTAENMGIRKTIRTTELLVYILFTFVGVIAIVFLAERLGYEPLNEWWKYKHFLFLFLPISFYQEFAYRGFLMHSLRQVFTNPLLIILLNAVIFMFLHVIYPGMLVTLPLALIAGLAFATLYYRHPNLLLISCSHAILNFVAVLYGFFSI